MHSITDSCTRVHAHAPVWIAYHFHQNAICIVDKLHINPKRKLLILSRLSVSVVHLT